MINSLKLKSLILLNGYTQNDLASSIGISSQAFNLKINNKRSFKINEVMRLCELLDINNFKDCKVIFFNDCVDLRQHNDK